MVTVAVLGIVLILLVLCGVWIGIAIGIVSAVGLLLLEPSRSIHILPDFGSQVTTGFTLSAVPLFLLMAEVLRVSGAVDSIFGGMAVLTRRLPGGLLHANIAAAGLFAATSGSSVATAAVIGPIAYDEEVTKRGYDNRIVLGSLTAGGTLGILIPPSAILIIYGVTVQQSVSKLFAAGLIPGLALAVLYALYAAARSQHRSRDGGDPVSPKEANAGPQRASVRAIALAAFQLSPFVLIAVVVLGFIYGGIATPTETAAIACMLSFIIVAVEGRMSFRVVATALQACARTTCMIFLLLICAQAFTIVMGYYHIPTLLATMTSSTSAPVLVLVVSLIYLVLGMFFDGISIMVLTLPIFAPALAGAGVSLLWFGILAVILIEAGLLTPPVGLNLFVVQGSTGAELMDVVRGSMPFVAIQLAFCIVLYFVPQIALWLPSVTN